MNYKEALNLLTPLKEDHILSSFNTLSGTEKKTLLRQVENLDIAQLKIQKNSLKEPFKKQRNLKTIQDYDTSGNKEDFLSGQKIIKEGLVGCLVVAGGQATRLKLQGPKGTCPITSIKHKSLFQLIGEKVLAASVLSMKPLPLAIMTSPLNHEETVNFFEKNFYFGLKKNQVSFYKQEMLPFLDTQGHLMIQQDGSLAEGPDGNGGALFHFFNSGLEKKWREAGVRYLNFILVDNPLADPFDAELIGYHKRVSADIVVKAIKREDPQELVGVLVKEEGATVVVEYTELSEEEKLARTNDNTLAYSLANISLFSFSLDFIKRLGTDKNLKIPLHKNLKAISNLNKNEEVLQKVWKFEKFIFDLLPFANKVSILVYPRETCFAPLKNFQGADSLDTVPLMIEKNDRRTLINITKTPCLVSPLEISQDFYYPTEQLKEQWIGKTIEGPRYIEGNVIL